MHYFRPLLVSLLFLLVACDEKPKHDFHLAKDYQRVEADWLTHDEAKLRHQSISNIEYFIQIDITKSERYFGTVEITFDYLPTPYPLTLDYIGGEAERVIVNNMPIGIEYAGNFISIPPENLEAGQNIIKVQFSHYYSDNGSGLHRYTDPTDDRTYIYTHFEPYDANKLFPSFDQPNLRALYKLKVVAPKKWTVVSSVRESEVITDGPYKRWTFPQSTTFSTYIFPLHAGPWHIWEGKSGKTPLRLMTRQSLAKAIDVREWFRITQQGFNFFENYFNMPYPYSKYDQLIVPDFNIGGMENVAAVTFTEKYIPRGEATTARKRSIANTILHELSHMWFGDLVTIDWWSDLWLKESFASYMAPLALSEATQYKDAWRAFYIGTKQGAYKADQRVTTHPINMPVSDTKSGGASFDSITYNKGAAVLQQLSHYLGEDEFKKGIRNYLKSFQNKAAKFNDFLISLESSSGEDLQRWTSEWINSSGVNVLKASYECENGEISEFKIKQKASEKFSTLRDHQLQIGLYKKNDEQRIVATNIETIRVSGDMTDVKQLIGFACPLLVYPNHGDWAYAKIELDENTRLLLPENINDIDDPLLRSMFWQSLWDMVRDIQMPLTEYIHLALENISLETDVEILNQILTNMNQAANWINRSSPINIESISLIANFEQLMLRNIQITDAESEQQKIWFEHYISIVHTDTGIDYLSKWLQGQREPHNLAENQDLRWQAVIQINASGHPDSEPLIKLERMDDRSDNGEMMALAARASRPDLDVKLYWLDELMKNEERQTAARLKQATKHLFPSSQSQLHRPFAERILKILHYLDANRGQPLVEHLVENILPTLCTNDSVALLDEAQNDPNSLGLIVQKGIKIAHQEDRRCVKINQLIKSRVGP